MGCHDRTDMGGTQGVFLTTHWSLIEDMKASPDRETALIGLLLQSYWKPVYCYLRRRGRDNEEAKDLTQDFFHEVVLNRHLVGRVEKDKGRFRTFLLHALNQYLANRDRDARAQKRIPREKLVSLDVAELPGLPASLADAAAEASYDYAWLSVLLERVVADVKEACRQQGLETHWALFQERVVEPILNDRAARPLAELCQTYGIEDTKTASNMIVTVKRRFRSALLEHIRNTVVSAEQVGEEVAYLLQFLPENAQRLE
ncbi:MAG: sigma-70 family RNA polymerase sigma factor [Sedimentisphaerales bacterium]|nr:sigma-70 family RNA polymerase sigma factor [Sedimentisphaerales bacterium]